jgi:N-acetyl-anhydromuramyl-L-alanine amidase AmpD
MIGEPNTQFFEAANHWDGREGQAPRYIILHGTAGGSSAQNIAAFFANPATQASAHYVIDQGGSIVQCVKEEDAAWANGPITGLPGVSGDGVHHDSWWDSGINPNLLTIAIEHVKAHTDNSDTLTSAQQASSFRLVQHICERWSIPKRYADAHGGITGHYSMEPLNRSRCPGPYPWNALWAFLKQGGTMIPFGWKDDGTILTAPNGVPVVHGFRQYILEYQDNFGRTWDANNTPMAPEEARSTLERGNPGLGAGTLQTFKGTQGYPARLEWTKDGGVFSAYAGQELYATEHLLAQYISASNITKAADALRAMIALLHQAQQDTDTLMSAAQNALDALGK